MARRKSEEPEAPGAGWMNTFADLMNLLLCFFVLLFSMSTVDADKYEQLVTSMTESISIFDGGGSSIGKGAFVDSGTDQLVAVSNYFNEFESTGDNADATNQQENRETGPAGADGVSQDTDIEKTKEQIADDLKAQEAREKQERTTSLYEKVVAKASEKNIEDQISVAMDKNYQFVQISLNGAILFESGTAEIKKSTLPLLSKVGDILKTYDSHMIRIEGHTDNVPISSAAYRNNMWLSTARATEVFEYLVNKKKISPNTLETTGRGEYDPVASNKTAKGRAQNRRVELKIYTDK